MTRLDAFKTVYPNEYIELGKIISKVGDELFDEEITDNIVDAMLSDIIERKTIIKANVEINKESEVGDGK